MLPCKRTVSSSCTSGFMELDLLKRRGERIPAGGNDGLDIHILDGEFRLVSHVSFSCSGNLTSLLIGATVRRKRDQYPQIQLWRTVDRILYKRQESQVIKLAVGDFSPDGVLQYNLSTPIQFQSGDVLGIYQPPQSVSAASVYYSIDTSAPNTYRLRSNPHNGASVSFSALSSISNQQILISPISG